MLNGCFSISCCFLRLPFIVPPGARRRGAELQGQIDGLIADKHRTQQKLAEVAAESEARLGRLQESKAEVAETQAKLSSRDTQLKDVSYSYTCTFVVVFAWSWWWCGGGGSGGVK